MNTTAVIIPQMSVLSVEQQHKQLNAISRVGDLEFLKISRQSQPIRAYKYEQIAPFIGLIFAKVMGLLGFKDPVDDFIKADISNALQTKYKGLTLFDIDRAFQKERYGELPPKTKHYQLFNAEYVCEVLDKYLHWQQETFRQNPKLLEREVVALPSRTSSQKIDDFFSLLKHKYQFLKDNKMLFSLGTQAEVLLQIGEIRLTPTQKIELEAQVKKEYNYEQNQKHKERRQQFGMNCRIERLEIQPFQMEKRLLELMEKNYLLSIKNIDEKIQQLKDNQDLIKLILQ